VGFILSAWGKEDGGKGGILSRRVVWNGRSAMWDFAFTRSASLLYVGIKHWVGGRTTEIAV
jgi:hypothetical protein